MEDNFRPCRYEDEKCNIHCVNPTEIKFTDDKYLDYFNSLDEE